MTRGAVFCPARRHRYALWRVWTDAPPLVVIGLNPSTATETLDDPTIRRCAGFARDWGHGGLVMLNLFAYRATHPRALYGLPPGDAIGAHADHWLQELCRPDRAGLVLAGWGTHGALLRRGEAVARLLAGTGSPLYALGVNRGGTPVHPLYQPLTARPSPYPVQS